MCVLCEQHGYPLESYIIHACDLLFFVYTNSTTTSSSAVPPTATTLDVDFDLYMKENKRKK